MKLVDYQWMGTPAHLVIFGWCIGLILLTPKQAVPWVAAACLVLFLVLYPASLLRSLRWRVLILLGMLIAVSVFWDQQTGLAAGDSFDLSTSLLSGGQMALRAFVILAAVDALTSSVDISEIAGLFERIGLHGLGFSLGVAMNLLPGLRSSSLNAWQSLWMRGGLRRNRLHTLQMLFLAILTSALRHSEDISLAAETRAYSPSKTRAMPIKHGVLDWVIILLGLVSAAGVLFYMG